MSLHLKNRVIDRFAVLSIVLSKQAMGLSLRHAIAETSKLPFYAINGDPMRLSVRTIYRWVDAFKRVGLQGITPLTPPSKVISRVLSTSFVDFMVCEKAIDADASIPDIILRAEIKNIITKGDVKRSTAWRAARRLNLPIFCDKRPKDEDMRRFAHPHRMVMVLCDGKHFRAGAKRRKRVVLFYIDDCSRRVLLAKASEDPEVQAAFGQILLLDPAYKRALPLNPKQPNTYEAPEGTTPETKLAQLERQLDLKRSAKDSPLSVEELVALTKHEDFATAQRANRLLRRISATAAAPILWERLARLTQRSQVQEVEDEILRLPANLATKLIPVDPTAMSLAAKGAWARIVAVRVSRVGKPRFAIKAAMLPLLKGPANELTEAAWAAVPRLFTEADRAALTEASQGLSERMAPKAKAALEALPAK